MIETYSRREAAILVCITLPTEKDPENRQPLNRGIDALSGVLNNGYTKKPKRRLWAVRSVVTAFEAARSGESPPLETL